MLHYSVSVQPWPCAATATSSASRTSPKLNIDVGHRSPRLELWVLKTGLDEIRVLSRPTKNSAGMHETKQRKESETSARSMRYRYMGPELE